MKRFFTILAIASITISSVGCVKVVNSVRMDANGKPVEYTEVQVGAIPPPCGCGYVHYHWNDYYWHNRVYIVKSSYDPYCR